MGNFAFDWTGSPRSRSIDPLNGHRADGLLERSFEAGPDSLSGTYNRLLVDFETPRRRWTINGDFTTLRPTGVARYAREVTLALDALISEGHPLGSDLEIDLVIPRPLSEPLRLDAISIRIVPELNRPRLPQFWVQAQLPWHVPAGLLSFCNLAPVALRRQIVCIHDIHTILMPSSYGRGFRWAHRLVLPILGRRAARITTVSKRSRDTLVDFGIAPEEKISVTYNGSDHAVRWDANRSSLDVTSDRPYVLCLGQEQKYKNIELLLTLAPLLDRLGIDLWMAGRVQQSTIERYASPSPRNLRLLGRISDHDLKKAFAGALCFLFPSRMEGFGLPAIEAMAAGCPVIASTSPCIPEVCGDAALYARPDDTAAWVERIQKIRGDLGLRLRLIETGHRRANSYSWRRIGELYLELMMKVDAAAASTS
jgi:glycosyltransferase involved in cell wall biosynthesis